MQSPLSEVKLTRAVIVSSRGTREFFKGVGGCSSTRRPRLFLYSPPLAYAAKRGLWGKGVGSDDTPRGQKKTEIVGVSEALA
jgi:hypothetical protein